MPGLLSSEKSIIQSNQYEVFLKRHTDRFKKITVVFGDQHPVKVRMYLPKTEIIEDQPDELIMNSISSALTINRRILNHVPRELNVLFVETTEDWNDFDNTPSAIRKIKGDRYKGYSQPDGIMCFTARGMEEETDAFLYSKDPILFKKSISL